VIKLAFREKQALFCFMLGNKNPKYYGTFFIKFLSLSKRPPYTLAGFDLTTLKLPTGDDYNTYVDHAASAVTNIEKVFLL
jgi:hypothetical protein